MINKKNILMIGTLVILMILLIVLIIIRENMKKENINKFFNSTILEVNKNAGMISCFTKKKENNYDLQVGVMTEFKDKKVYTYYEYIYEYKEYEKYELEKGKNIDKENFVFNDEKMIIIEKTELKEKKDIDIDKYIKNLSMNPTCMLVK